MNKPKKNNLPLWRMRLIAIVLVPVFILVLAEIGLRVIGYGHSTRFWKPSKVDGVKYFVPNTTFNYRFFPPALARAPLPMRLLQEKPANTFRIFLFGESAAYGDPEPSYGMGRQLEVLLNERYSGINFEVICTAMTAINSHAILPIARDSTKLEGDLWIVYMGNNEMVGAYGASTVFNSKAPPLWVVRSALMVKATRIGQLLDNLLYAMRGETLAPEDWDGIEMFTQNPLSTDDPKRLIAYQNFQRNLEDIIKVANRADIPVILSTVASNLKDCSPFISLQTEGNTSAEQYFQQGHQFLQSGQLAEARAALEKARDHDALAVRADSRINNIIRDEAQKSSKRRITFLDAEEKLAAISPNGIPGNKYFYEHVHFTLEGNYQLARMLAEQVAAQIPASDAITDSGIWAEPREIQRNLAITLWDQHRLWNNMLIRSSAPPFTNQSNHQQQLVYLQQQAQAVIARINADTPHQDRRLYERALARNPNDTTLLACYSQYLEAIGARAEAIEKMSKVCELLPDLEWPHFYHGELLRRIGNRTAARASFQRALAIRPDFAQARQKLEEL